MQEEISTCPAVHTSPITVTSFKRAKFAIMTDRWVIYANIMVVFNGKGFCDIM